MIKIQDLNAIIRYFSVEMQKRVNQLEAATRFSKSKNKLRTQISTFQIQVNEVEEDSHTFDNLDQIIDRYQNYTPNEMENEYMKKMVDRVLQIFGFFKWRCRNQSILNHVERQLTSKLHILISESPINIQKIMSYIIDICKKELISKKIGYAGSINKSPTMLGGFIKTKRTLFSRSQTKQLKQITSSNVNSIPAPELPFRKRTASGMSNYMNNYTHHAVDIIYKLYASMNLERSYMRFIESETYLMRDQLKRNKNTIKKIQGYENKILQKQTDNKIKSLTNSSRKLKTEEIENNQYHDALMQIKINTRPAKALTKISNFCYEGEAAKAPVMNLSIFARKRCKVKTMCMQKTKEKKNYPNENNFIC